MRQEVRSAVASHFWEQPVPSAHSLDGLAYTLPAEPLPVLPAPSGLSRTQQLVALQALPLPAVPAYDESAGGVVSATSSEAPFCCQATQRPIHTLPAALHHVKLTLR